MSSTEKIDTVGHAIIENNISYNNHMSDNQTKMTTTVEKKFKLPSSNFTDYLNNNRVSTVKKNGVSTIATHLNMCQPYGKFSISDMKTFMPLYEEELKNGSTLGIVEKPLSHMETPLVADIDFKYILEEKDEKTPLFELRKHNYKIIKEILLAYKKVYDDNFYFRNPEDKHHCYFFISQRQEPYIVESGNVKYVKDGFHIMNPGYRAFPKIHLEMRKKIIQDEELKKCIQSLGTINNIDNTLDEAVICKNGWLMYGSSKPDKKPYEIEYIFDSALNEANKEELGIASYPRYLSYWRTSTKHAVPIKKVIDSFIQNQLLHSINEDEEENESSENIQSSDEKSPSSNNVNDSSVEEPQNKAKKKKPKKNKSIEIVEAENPDNSDESFTEKVKLLVEMLSEKRGTNKSLWKEVGECLKVFSPEYLEIWVEFTEKYEQYTEEDCNREWKTFPDEGSFTMATLKFWASRDNNDKYTAFKRNEIRKFLMACINTTHVDVAQTLFLMYESDYVCASVKNNTWYEFRKHRWYEIEAGISLRKKISKELAIEYTRFRKFCTKMAEGSIDDNLPEDLEYDISDNSLETDERSQEEWLSMASICDEVVIKLKTKGYKDSLLGEAKEFFYDGKFEEKLNERHELIGFENGIVDLDKRIFREGRPDDYITFSTKTKYNPDYKNTNEYVQIMEFLKQIYLTDEMVHYGLKERALMIHGDNFEERLYTHIGAGGNGKSKLRELCAGALGDYVFGFPVTLFTGRLTASSSASPEVARSKGKRMAFVDEPEHKTNFNIGLAKKFSGGDPIETRKLFGDMFEFIPQFSITLLCNNIPGFPAHDEGAQRRLTITEFLARFVENPVANNEFKRDKLLSNKLKIWKHVFASLLVDYFYVYQEEGLNPPEDVTKFTMQFIKECDTYNEFISDVLIEDTTESYVTIKDLYNSFRSWVDDNGASGGKPMSLSDFKKYICKKVTKPGSIKDGRIYGYRERSDNGGNEYSY
jgi:P4 family phage/plasmid primase-like protien